MQEKTKEIIKDLYRKSYRTTFTKQFKQTLDLLDVKSIAKSVKQNIEDIWEETCVERQNNIILLFTYNFLTSLNFYQQQKYELRIMATTNTTKLPNDVRVS